MNDIEFAALLVSRVCHDLVSPVGAVVNGLEVLGCNLRGSLSGPRVPPVPSSI